MATAKLRAVKPGEEAPAPTRTRRKPPPTVSQAAESGSERDLLVALSRRLSKALDDPKCQPAPLAALTARLLDLRREIAAIDAAARGEAGSSSQEGGTGGAVGDQPFDAAAV